MHRLRGEGGEPAYAGHVQRAKESAVFERFDEYRCSFGAPGRAALRSIDCALPMQLRPLTGKREHPTELVGNALSYLGRARRND
jgi:hypothetical protein